MIIDHPYRAIQIAYLEFQAAMESLDRDRLAKAIEEYEPFAYGEAKLEIERAKEIIARSKALSELVAETERLGLYELGLMRSQGVS